MPSAFRITKTVIYGLLALNVALYLFLEKFVDSIDSVGWLVLVGLFEFETMRLARHRMPPVQQFLELAARVIGYTLILYAWYGFLQAGEWLNFANSTTWLLVSISLEYDVRIRADYGSRAWHIRNVIKFTLYGLLSAFAILWGLDGDWLDFHDAVMWLLAFFVIELNVFGFEKRHMSAKAQKAGVQPDKDPR